MNNLKIIAIEKPFNNNFKESITINGIVTDGKDLYLYCDGNKIKIGTYKARIDDISHITNEGKYEWVLHPLNEGQILTMSVDDLIYIDNRECTSFNMTGDDEVGSISQPILKIFNDFLKWINHDKPQIKQALDISLKDGFFRSEVEGIVVDDVILDLSILDKEIIVRSGFEGYDYIINHVKKHLQSKATDMLVECNQFFRRVFNLKRYV